MHLIHDENGNHIAHAHGEEHNHCHEHSHGGHTHEHTHCHEHGQEGNHDHGHDHGHSHSHGCGHSHEGCSSCGGGDCTQETVALLTYMLQHNEHHAAELEQMAVNLQKMGMDAAAKQISEGVSEFQKGNMRLSLALTLVKEQLKEA